VNTANDALSPSQDTAFENLQICNACFHRGCNLLVSVARHVLSRQENPEEAIYNRWRVASRNPPRFEHEGAFRCRLVRVLLDSRSSFVKEEGVEVRAMARKCELYALDEAHRLHGSNGGNNPGRRILRDTPVIEVPIPGIRSHKRG